LPNFPLPSLPFTHLPCIHFLVITITCFARRMLCLHRAVLFTVCWILCTEIYTVFHHTFTVLPHCIKWHVKPYYTIHNALPWWKVLYGFCWNYFSSQQFENLLRIDKVIAMSLVYHFFGTQCIY